VGRQVELEQVRQLLADPVYRLLTLTGAGGVGKTRLALQAAGEMQSSYPQGAWLVELASLSDPELVPQTVAAAFDLHSERDLPILTVLVDTLRSRNLLLVLDNCEHLVAACGSLANTLLRGCPDLHILATSREALGIEAERTYFVPSLSFPGPGEKIAVEELTKYAAVDLFTRRAQVALPDFELDEANAAAVTGICRHLDGIPLALELAAARLRVMDVEQIASQLEDRFHLLSGGDRTSPPRLQTMHASIDWSYQLLTYGEKNLLRRLSVFAGGWSLAAARAVCADESLPEASIPDLLGGLVNKSLVQMQRRKGRELRYRMLETLRQYGQEKLLEAGELSSTRGRQLAHFVSLAGQAAAGLEGANAVLWLKQLDDELDNLRLALEWALANNVEAGLNLVCPIRRFWFLRGRTREHCDWITRLLDRLAEPVPPLLRARTLGIKASDLRYLGELDQARACAELSLTFCRELGDRQCEAFCLDTLANLQKDNFSIQRLLEQSLALYRELGDKAGQAEILSEMVDSFDCSSERGRLFAEESLALYRQMGDPITVSAQLVNLANTLIQSEDYATARKLVEEALPMQQQLGLKFDIISTLTTVGRLAFWQGDWQQARARFEESIALSNETGVIFQGFWTHAMLAYLFLRQGETALARIEFVDSLNLSRNIGRIVGKVFVLEGLASLALAEGRSECAASLFAWADSMRATIGAPRPTNEQADVERDLAAIRAKMDKSAIQAAEAAGRDMTLEEAVAFALKEKIG
jgi:predicted ATPase